MSRIHNIFAEHSRAFSGPVSDYTEYYRVDGRLRAYPLYVEINTIAGSILNWLESNYLWGSRCAIPRYVVGCIDDIDFIYVADLLDLKTSEWSLEDEYLVLNIDWWKYE